MFFKNSQAKKSKKIKVFWYRHKTGKGNFGDELNPYLLQKLTGYKVDYIKVEYLNDHKWLALKLIISALFNRKIELLEALIYVWYNFVASPKFFFAVGSVLHYNKFSKSVVWGSGIVDLNYPINNAVFLAVRGKYTQSKLKELGYKAPEIIGDPALLLPLIYKPISQNKYQVGIIPHYVHYDEVKNKINTKDVIVIDLTQEVEKVIQQILSCKVTVSTSLHGIIISHAYNIPSVWIEFEGLKNKLAGDNIKFKDYFSSVGLEEYSPKKFETVNGFYDLAGFTQILEYNFKTISLPEEKKVREIQEGLLKVAPFKLNPKNFK